MITNSACLFLLFKSIFLIVVSKHILPTDNLITIAGKSKYKMLLIILLSSYKINSLKLKKQNTI